VNPLLVNSECSFVFDPLVFPSVSFHYFFEAQPSYPSRKLIPEKSHKHARTHIHTVNKPYHMPEPHSMQSKKAKDLSGIINGR
jgi:hypothetical protein